MRPIHFLVHQRSLQQIYMATAVISSNLKRQSFFSHRHFHCSQATRMITTFATTTTPLALQHSKTMLRFFNRSDPFKKVLQTLFQARSFSIPTSSNGNDGDQGKDLDMSFFEGLYFIGEIPKDRIVQKWSKASGPGGAHVNSNPTKAEIRFQLDEADWIPEKVRERLAQKYPSCINSQGEFHATSQRTRSAAENMEECFDKLNTMLREASVDLVKERRREYIPSEFAEEIKERRERSEEYRILNKRKNKDKKAGRKVGYT